MAPTRLDRLSADAHPVRVRRISAFARVTAVVLAAALIAALVIHASHGHDGAETSQLHATCVVCQVGSPVGTQPVAANAPADATPICHLSLADRDHAIPPARVEVDLSRAPPSLLAI
jgi:hypothetical protein